VNLFSDTSNWIPGSSVRRETRCSPLSVLAWLKDDHMLESLALSSVTLCRLPRFCDQR
jgi:hypothetical protein